MPTPAPHPLPKRLGQRLIQRLHMGALLGACLPSQCEVCHAWAGTRLCEACQIRFAAPRPRCQRCALPVATDIPCCGACLQQAPAFEHCLCMADYAFPWDRVISRFKYHDAPELATLLADGLLQAARAAATPVGDAFLPIPLAATRLAERGYDQAWELARRLGPALQRPAWPRALQRHLAHPAQATLSRRERLANLRGAFSVPPEALAQVQGRHLVLVDDVLTTGATAHEAAQTLRLAGAARVDLWVLARTPEPAAAH